MPGSEPVATHGRAGCIEPTRLGARFSDGTVAPPAGESTTRWSDGIARGPVRLGAIELDVALSSEGEVAFADARVRNAGAAPVHLESVVLGFRWRGHGVRSLRYLRNGWQSWSHAGALDLGEHAAPEPSSGPWMRGIHHAVGEAPADRAGWHESDLVTAIGRSPSGPACLAGVLERGDSFGVIYARREGGDVRVEVEHHADAVLQPGESRRLERVYLALGEDASALLEAFAESLGRRAGARAEAPFVSGWCSWYHFFHDVTEEDVRRNLAALADARGELPIEVVQLDDGYQRAVGDWLETNPKFPRGLAPLAGEIRAAGFVPGLWTAPFCVVAESRLFASHPEWLLRSGDEPFRGVLHPVWSADGSVYVLDTGREDVLEHLRGLFRELVAMGFHYLKLDFLYAAAMRCRASDPHVTRAQRLRRGLEAVRAGAGGEAFLLGCGCPLGAAVGVVDAMRVSNDVAPTWRADERLQIPGLESVPSTRSAVRDVLARAWMHRRLWINDPDCLMLRARDTDLASPERRTLAAAIAGTGGMLLFSDDVPSLSGSERRLLRETLEAAREVDGFGIPGGARALGLLAGEIPGGVAAASAAGGIVALVNGGDEPLERAVDLGSIGGAPLEAPPEPLIGSPKPTGPDLRVALEPHDSALLRVRRAPALAVFCDFDGTFSVQDVGATLAQRHLADRRPAAWARFERGELTAWEYNLELLEGFALPRSEVEAFLETVELDPGARELTAWCAARDVPFRVLSDGFDFNLNRLQLIHGVRFAYDANHLRFEGGTWRIASGHPNPGCACGTGTCKRGRIEAFRAEHPRTTLVHVGNGRVSDLCGALAADWVFAKDTLAEELERRGEPFERFHTLRDVIPRLEARLGTGTLFTC